MSRTLLHCVLVALPLASCGPTPMRPAHECQRPLYVPTGETMQLSVQVDLQMSNAFEVVGYCLLLDGATLATQDGTSGSAVARRPGEPLPPLRWEGPISRGGLHQLALVAWMRRTGDYDGYRFDVKSAHYFVLTGDVLPTVRAVLYERPDLPHSWQSPTVKWQPNAGMTLPPDWKPPWPVAR